MKPTSNRRKFLLPAAIIVIVIVAGLIIVNGKIANQGASFITGVNKLGSVTNAVPYPGSKGLPCLVGNTTPQIRVTSPNGGEAFTAGQQIPFKWSSCNIPANAQILVVLEQLQPNGTLMVINGYVQNQTGTSNGTTNDGSDVFITTYNQQDLPGQFKITLTYILDPNHSVTDISDNLFTINAPQVSCVQGLPLITQIGSPITGGVLNHGGNATISWNWCNVDPSSLVLTTLESAVNSNITYPLSSYNTPGAPGSSTGYYSAVVAGGSDLVVIPTNVPAGQYKVHVYGKTNNNTFGLYTGAFTVH